MYCGSGTSRHNGSGKHYRKYFKIILFLSCAALVFVAAALSISPDAAYAADTEDKLDEIEKDINEEIDKELDILLNEELENYFSESVKEVGGFGSLKQFVKSVINGETTVSVNEFIDLAWDAFKQGIVGALASVAVLVVLSVLGGMSDALTAGFKRKETKQVVYFAIYAGIVASLAGIVVSLSGSVTDAVSDLSALIKYTTPVFATLLTALGGAGGAEMLAPFTLLISGLVINVISSLILPMFFASVVFTIIGNLSESVKLSKLTKAVKSAGSWIMGIMFGLITTFAGIQGLVGAGIDTVAVKSAKFALSSYVPILGGYLSEGFDIVLASGVLIKNALGLGVFVVLSVIIVVPIVKLVLFSSVLKLAAGIIEPVGDPRISELIYNTASNFNLLIAAIAGVGFLIFVMLMIIIGAYNVGVV